MVKCNLRRKLLKLQLELRESHLKSSPRNQTDSSQQRSFRAGLRSNTSASSSKVSARGDVPEVLGTNRPPSAAGASKSFTSLSQQASGSATQRNLTNQIMTHCNVLISLIDTANAS